MHELSIVEALIATVRSELAAQPGATVRRLHLRLGALRLVRPETLRFCYTAATADDPALAGSELALDQVDAAARCDACAVDFAVCDRWFVCPQCGATTAGLLTGNELILDQIEFVVGLN